MRGVVLASIALLAAGWPDRAPAQGMEYTPMPEIAGIFAEGNRARLGGPEGRTVRALVLLGELGRVYGVNFFALPDVDRLGERAVPDTVEARAVAWIVRIGAIRPEDAPLEANQYSGLNSMRWAFADYLRWASDPAEPRLYPAVRGPDFLEPPPLG